MEQYIPKLLLIRTYERNGKQKKAKRRSRRIPGTVKFVGFKQNNVGLPEQNSCDLLFQEVVSMFWITEVTVLSCHICIDKHGKIV